MEEDEVVEVDDGSSPGGTSILEREERARGEQAPTPKIVRAADEAGEDDEDEDEDEEDEPITRVATPVAPTLADPGEYVPNDYTFEVVVYDGQGKNARTHKIKSVDEWDELLERDPNLGSASALLKAQRAATKMETSLERDKREYDGKKTAFEQEKASVATRQAATDTMVSEIGYLQSKGKLPQVDAKYVDADWGDPEVAKQPGVREQVRLLNYMRDENKARVAAKLKPMTSILDAYNAYVADGAEKDNVTRKRTAGAQRKAAGARVASVSSAPVGAAPPGVSVGRGGSLRDLGRQGF